MVSAIAYLHSEGVCHRDLKLENVMFRDKSMTEVCLIDFGMAKIAKGNHLGTKLGTPYYVAPEVLNGQYCLKCDVWSLGIIAYFLLAGEPPFQAESISQLFMKIYAGEVSFKNPVWKHVSSSAKNFITQLLSTQVNRRPSAEETLKHEWLKSQ